MDFIQSELASNIAGYTSIGCWIVVFIPQLWTNYKRKSCGSLSVAFIWIWLAGDILNLVGASLQNLLFTMIALAVYYVVTDIALLGQIYYYRDSSREHPQDELVVDETTPLASSSQYRRSTTALEHLEEEQQEEEQNEKTESSLASVLKLFALVVAVSVVGCLCYYLSTTEQRIRRGGNLVMSSLSPLSGPRILRNVVGSSFAQTLGWGSALLYLGSRIPQIVKIYKSKSCDGLSLALFFFSVIGNTAYVLSILFYSVEHEYLTINLPWIIGSAGTLLFDFIIFGQFYLYRNNRPSPDRQVLIMTSEIV